MASLIPQGPRLLLVAHPDDETLWCGGLLLRHPGSWTVQACSIPSADPIRAEKFIEACWRLGVRGHVLPEVEQYGTPLRGLGTISLDGFAVIVTHGLNGEYGHPHHMQVHDWVREHARCKVVTIGWNKGTHCITLDADERAGKLHALKAYNHILPYEGVPMAKYEALLARYGAGWLEREFYDGS